MIHNDYDRKLKARKLHQLLEPMLGNRKRSVFSDKQGETQFAYQLVREIGTYDREHRQEPLT